MAGLTRSQLRDEAKQRAHMENGSFVTDPEWNTYLDQSASELHDLILLTDPKSIVTVASVSVSPNTEAYALPANFYKEIALYWMAGNYRQYALERFNMHEIGNYGQFYTVGLVSGQPMKYDLVGNQLWLYPIPNAGGTIQTIYTPQYTRFVNDASTLDYPVVNGWEQFVTVTTAIKAKTKEQTDISALLAEKTGLEARIVKHASNRDRFGGGKVRDVYGYSYPLRRSGWWR